MRSKLPNHTWYEASCGSPLASVAIGVADWRLREYLASSLAQDGFLVMAFEDGLDMLDYFGDILLLGAGEILPDLIIAEANLPGRKGIDLLADLRYAGWATPFILITQKNDTRTALDVRKMKAAASRVKLLEAPCRMERLRYLARSLLGLARPRRNRPGRSRRAAAA